MNRLFIGPRLLAGIGQVTKRYADLCSGDYVEIGQRPPKMSYDKGFAFILPLENQLQIVAQYATICKEMEYMSICETETVNPVYSLLVRFNKILVASEFCKEVFERQFPTLKCDILHLYAKPMPIPKSIKEIKGAYKFYTIGNIADPRKNINMLLEVFQRFDPVCVNLILKATCNQSIELKMPGVVVINGLLSDEHMESIHNSCDCYINCSHSEGVGMGAVEAALRSKPVIIPDYGGLKEYVKTPWVVPCKKGRIGFDDFLFTKDLVWGFPDREVLYNHMVDVFSKKINFYDHSHTRELMTNLESKLKIGG